MLPLRTTLIINGISSGATGALMIIFPKFLAEVFEVNATAPFNATGIFLAGFATLVLATAFQKNVNSKLVRLIITLDTLWVVGSAMLILLGYQSISAIGLILIAAVALWVAAMAYLQTKGISVLGEKRAKVITSIILLAMLSTAQVEGQPAHDPVTAPSQSVENLVSVEEKSLSVVNKFLEAVKEKSHAKAAPLLDSLVQWHQPGNNRFSGVKSNANEVFSMFRGFLDMTAGALQLKEWKILGVNNNTVACLLHWTAVTPPGSKLDVENVDVYTVTNGKIVKAVIYSADVEQENKFWWK